MLVRIASLIAAGNNGVIGQATGLDDGGIDNGAKSLRCEWHVVVSEAAIAIHLGAYFRRITNESFTHRVE